MADPYFELGAQLGNLATGGWRDNSHKAYYDQLGRVGQAEGLLAQARSRRAQALIDEGQQQQIGRWAADPAAAAAELGTTPGGIGVLLGGGGNAAQLATALGTLGETGFRRDAAARATLGDWNGANAALMGVANGPVQLGTVEGQNLLQNRLLVGGGGISTTEQGQAGIAADAARARASDASAASSYASANATNQRLQIAKDQFALQRAGRWDPSGANIGATPASKATEGERNAAGFLQRMQAASGELGALTDAGYDPTNLRDFATAGSLLGNFAASDQGQQYHQAAMNWIRANLRKESGAAIGKDEADNEYKNYFPQPGDSAAVIQQKARNRAVTESAMRQSAGRAFQPGALLGDSPAASATSSPVQRARNPKTGQTLVLVNGQWVPE
ncbi:hypothetical protein [Pseudoxanthomonas sp. X-1]|uniref:hypothetical protein n=1 Tax=Pseudoxanthomonas sp. X-1 TaxID=2571115 RepID=UPI00110B16DD|nr:hypothetical protein [Pseudoxanthomonas sp. X-1]TMN18466.1 hypothetical protein FF950_14375 [Pseudoxanthomonas sp. X-1]UAY76033.1 hypothetical protein LAJ50_07300 [Pseudoxanthomonas sp. X-1]